MALWHNVDQVFFGDWHKGDLLLLFPSGTEGHVIFFFLQATDDFLRISYRKAEVYVQLRGCREEGADDAGNKFNAQGEDIANVDDTRMFAVHSFCLFDAGFQDLQGLRGIF